MQRSFLNGIATRLAIGTTALAGMLLFYGLRGIGTVDTRHAGAHTHRRHVQHVADVTVSDATPGAVLHCTV